MWSLFNNKKTQNKKGSEGGIIIKDEEHSDGARITLEKDADIAPFAITVGVYGCFFHTIYISEIKKSDEIYESMKNEISKFLLNPKEPKDEWIENFVNKYH